MTGASIVPAGRAGAWRRSLSDAPAFLVPETERIAADEVRWDDVSAGLTLRLGLPVDSQLALSIPYRREAVETVTRVDFADVNVASWEASGYGDLALTISKGLLRERGWRPDLVLGMTWDSKSGQDDGGVSLGTRFHELTANLTATKSQDPLVLVASVSYSQSSEEGGYQPGDLVRLSLGTVLAASPETSLRFFLDQNFFADAELNGGDVPGSDAVVSLFSIGLSSILSPRVFLDVELSVGLTEAAPKYGISVALPIRF